MNFMQAVYTKTQNTMSLWKQFKLIYPFYGRKLQMMDHMFKLNIGTAKNPTYSHCHVTICK
jgi:hypothetical protein